MTGSNWKWIGPFIALIGIVLTSWYQDRQERIELHKVEQQQRIRQLEEDKNEANRAKSQAGAERDRMASERDAARDEALESRNRIAILESEVNGLRDENDRLRAQKADLESRLQQELKQRLELEREYQSLLTQLQLANKSNEALRRSLSRANAQLEESGLSLLDEMWTNLVRQAEIDDCMPYVRNGREAACMQEASRKLEGRQGAFERCVVEGRSTPFYMKGVRAAIHPGDVLLENGAVVFCDLRLTDAAIADGEHIRTPAP